MQIFWQIFSFLSLFLILQGVLNLAEVEILSSSSFEDIKNILRICRHYFKSSDSEQKSPPDMWSQNEM